MSRENSLQPLVTLYCASKPTVSAQIAKYPNLFILGLSQDGKNGLCQFLDIRKMTQGLEQSHLNRCGYHLRKMVYEKQDRGLFVAILRFCHITINYLLFWPYEWSNILTIIGRAEGKSALSCIYE